MRAFSGFTTNEMLGLAAFIAFTRRVALTPKQPHSFVCSMISLEAPPPPLVLAAAGDLAGLGAALGLRVVLGLGEACQICTCTE